MRVLPSSGLPVGATNQPVGQNSGMPTAARIPVVAHFLTTYLTMPVWGDSRAALTESMSVDVGVVAHMYESGSGRVSGRVLPPEAMAGLEEIFERWRLRNPTGESAGLMGQIGAAVRIENRAVAAQLTAIGQLFRYRLAQCSETEDWAIDTMEAVAAEVAAGLRISQGLATDRVHYARAMGERLPKVGEVFAAGDIDCEHDPRTRGTSLADVASSAMSSGVIAAVVGWRVGFRGGHTADRVAQTGKQQRAARAP
jgi:hypothetical protein